MTEPALTHADQRAALSALDDLLKRRGPAGLALPTDYRVGLLALFALIETDAETSVHAGPMLAGAIGRLRAAFCKLLVPANETDGLRRDVRTLQTFVETTTPVVRR